MRNTAFSFRELEIHLSLRFHVLFRSFKNSNTMIFFFTIIRKIVQISCEGLPFNHARLQTFHRIRYSSKVCFEEGGGGGEKKEKERRKELN